MEYPQNKNWFRILLLTFLMVSFTNPSQAQKVRKYLVYLQDKNDNPYSINKPEEFLSKRAIERRQKRKPKIAITERDLPVSPQYIENLKNEGADIWYTSKWMNAVMLEADENAISIINSLEFVKKVTPLTKKKGRDKIPYEAPKDIPEYQNIDVNIGTVKDYGLAQNQVTQIGADKMHEAGYTGEGMIIAVFDAGFQNAYKLPFFEHLYASGKILGAYDFVEYNENVYKTGDHGTKVFSCIGAYQKGDMIGTAPEASFYLFRTEDASTEFIVEEVNWLIAAERADSAGVDIINSSLGYNTFDDNSMNYTYEDMDGNTTIITQAADMAVGTGMIVVTSAGNEGGSRWQYVSAPADADSVIAVGAVDKKGEYVYFSSTGMTSDGRIKPNIAAKGLGSTVGAPSGGITTSSGTSFSSPIMCGLVAGVWQANPKLNNMEIMEILQRSGTQASNPDSLLGYGIPNFEKAQEMVKIVKKEKTWRGMHIYPNPIFQEDHLKIFISQETFQDETLNIAISDISGNLIAEYQIEATAQEYVLPNLDHLKSGMYILTMSSSSETQSSRILKL